MHLEMLTFANELSMICDEYKINTKELISIANFHPRVNILNPGCGVGGHCIAVDPWFLISDLPKKAKLLRMARDVNNEKAFWVLDCIRKKVSELEKKLKHEIKIGCLGLTFKPDVDDTRESPAFLIVEKLLEYKYNILPCDPNIRKDLSFKLFSTDETIRESDLIIILVAHSEFKDLNLENINFLDFSGFY